MHTCCASHGLNTEMITTHAVEDDHIKWCCRGTLSIKATDMEALRIWASMHQLMHRSRVAMKGKHDRLVFSKVLDERGIVHAMRMQIRRIEGHQVDHVDHTD